MQRGKNSFGTPMTPTTKADLIALHLFDIVLVSDIGHSRLILNEEFRSVFSIEVIDVIKNIMQVSRTSGSLYLQ